jgi:hypothetical protein
MTDQGRSAVPRRIEVTKLLVRIAKACALAAAVLTISGASLGAVLKFKYEGTWEGTLSDASVPKEDKEITWRKTNQVRLVFTKGKVSVYHFRDGEWRESKPGNYSISILDTNAIIASITTGRDADGVWVETRSLQLTAIDPTHLHVLWQRQVKNKDMEPSNPNAVWGVMGYGELTRVGAPGA